MKKGTILNAVLGLSLFASIVLAAPRAGVLVQRVVVNDGNTRAGLSVSCSESAWTRVVAASPRRRKTILSTPPTASGPVCLGTSDDLGVCQDSTPGAEIGTSDNHEDSSEAVLYCRARAGSGGSVRIKGFEYYDNRDETAE